MIELESIAFDHDVSSATADALTIRRDYTTDSEVPEWRNGVTVDHVDCPVAYTRSAALLTVKVSFRRLDPSLRRLRVRTINRRDTRAQGCLYWLLEKLGWKFVLGPPQPPVLNVLGEVKERSIAFANDIWGPHELSLTDTLLASSPVGIHDDVWQWQYKLDSGEWTDFATSRYRVFVVLGVPTAPWVQSGNRTDTSLPWVRALNRACRWAEHADTAVAAAGGITRGIFNIAPGWIEYDCPGGGETNYAYPDFDLTAFLEVISGYVGRGRYVNCTDCATAVSTFANLVGCDLWQSRMGVGFDLNPILAIGSSQWQTACQWGSFAYHEVAWTGSCTENDRVYDACLKVDGDDDPTTAPHTGVLPIDMRFGAEGAGQYRDRLAAPSGRATCEPMTSTRTRRAIY